MSDVASLELSRELSELSKWVTGKTWGDAEVRGRVAEEDYDVPRYELGYLIRKLPTPRLLQFEAGWECYSGLAPSKYYKWATIPEDAAAKLCILLIKADVLQKDMA